MKTDLNIKGRSSGCAAIQLLLVVAFSLIINPIAALAGDHAFKIKYFADPSPASASPTSGLPQTTERTAPFIPLTVFSNPTSITVPDFGQTQSSITVAGTSGPVAALSLSLTGLSLPAGTQDLDILLVGPGGQKYIFFSDVGGLFSTTTNVNITLSDAAASLLPNSGSLSSGTFKPTDYGTAGTDSFVAPAPGGPYQEAASAGAATFTSVFGGLSGASVNGTWTIYLADDTGTAGSTVTVSGGWSLDITTTAAAATTTTLSSSLNPSSTNQAVTFTSTTTSSSTVNTGTVNFVDTTTGITLCSTVAVNGSGVATCTVPANTLTERRHTIQATYNANATFATSNGSLTQTVNFPTSQSGSTFTNAGGITLADNGNQSLPYPSNIVVSGLSGTISKVTLTLTNATFANTNDQNFLLVGPAGQKFVFMSDAGGAGATSGATITFDDAAASQLPNSGSIASGTYRPTDYVVDSDIWPAPAPAGPYNSAAPGGSGTFATVFGGAAPNGTWSLYPIDDTGSAGAAGSIGSWSLTFTTSGDAATTTTLASNPNPSTTSQSFLLTATVTSGTTVNAGTVTFRRGATVICAAVAVSNGTATCNSAALPQGDYVITADYNGSPGQFNISSGTVTQQVNSPTVITGNNYANNGGITIANNSIGSPYPSRIIVNGVAGLISKVTVTLNGVNAPTPDDVDLLLVGPGGQKYLLMGDAGGATAIVNQNITLDDAAASALPDSTAIVSGTYKPASYTGSDNFPAPAPAAPYNPAAPDGAGTFANTFNGIPPNGTWSLYAVEDAGDAQNTTIAGWSITFTLAPSSTTTTVTSSLNPSTTGQAVTFTATVSPVSPAVLTPTGTVSIYRNGETFTGCSNLTLNASGQASCTITFTVGTNYSITAQYGGATNVSASTSATLTQQVTGFPPTAADVSLNGRVVSPDGNGIPYARLRLTDAEGNARLVTASPFGYYQFAGVAAGKTYVLSVEAKGYRFDSPSMTVTVNDNLADLNFIGHR